MADIPAQARAQRISRRPLDGVFLLDKPLGISSNQALQRVKWLLAAQKAGHTGTLDPAATGLLILCFGEATKLAGISLEEDKTYEASIVLGSATDTGDAQGQVIALQAFTGTDADIDAALAGLRGDISQTPPMYSALKHAGKPLYDYARAGVHIEREVRAITIHQLDLLGRDGDRLRVRVTCSKGTYIRVLAEQIGAALNCAAHLASLRRTRVGTLDLGDALTLDALEALPVCDRPRVLQPPESLLKSVPSLVLDEAEERAVRQGKALRRVRPMVGLVRMHAAGGVLVGLAQVGEDGMVQPKRILLESKN